MADGRWVMTEDELDGVASGFAKNPYKELPHWGKRAIVDAREEGVSKNVKTVSHQAVNNSQQVAAKRACAFCGAESLIPGLGGYGEGYVYSSCRCRACGGLTDFVTKDEVGKFFK